MSQKELRVRGVLALTNSQPTKVRVTLEPWADEEVLAAGGTIEIAFSGPANGRMEVELKPGEIVVYGWEGADMSIVK